METQGQEVIVVEEVQQKQIAVVQELTVSELVRRNELVKEIRAKVMKEDVHYGKIPGCGKKPTLLKPGAEILKLTFRLTPKIEVKTIDLGGGHREVQVVTSLYHIHSGEFYGQAYGSCSTMESKYRYRSTSRKCPKCNGEFIIKGKADYGGGWLCYKKKGGCGTKFNDKDPTITKQEAVKVENQNPADEWNTVAKMAVKRSDVAATISATGASEDFTQDIEDMDLAPKEPEKSPPVDGNGTKEIDLSGIIRHFSKCKSILELNNSKAEHLSKTAWNALSKAQKAQVQKAFESKQGEIKEALKDKATSDSKAITSLLGEVKEKISKLGIDEPEWADCCEAISQDAMKRCPEKLNIKQLKELIKLFDEKPTEQDDTPF